MSKTRKVSYLIEQEKLLYLEVEQLRRNLFLHDESVLFEFFSAFYFVAQDIKKLFVKNKKECSFLEKKRKSIASLTHIKKNLLFLKKTPYAWIIYSLRSVRHIIASLKLSRIRLDISKKTQTFIMFGTTNVYDLQSRSVQIAKETAGINKVIYIEGIFDEGENAGYRITEKSVNFIGIRLTALKSFHLNYQKPSQKEIAFLKRSLALFFKKSVNFKPKEMKMYIHHPFWKYIVSLKKREFLFDNANNFSHLQNAAQHIIDAEKTLLKKALLVTAPQPTLSKKNIVIKDGVDWEIFKDTSKSIQTCDVGLCWIKKPVMGFIGTLDERIDEILLGKLAHTFPNLSIVLVGNTDYRPVIEVAEQYPNIFPVGKQPYNKLPLYLQSFDILIIPYKVFPQGTANFPELSLYLASGKPVVATVSCIDGKLKECIYTPASHISWMDKIAEALKEKKRNKKKHMRIAHAKKMAWKVKI